MTGNYIYQVVIIIIIMIMIGKSYYDRNWM